MTIRQAIKFMTTSPGPECDPSPKEWLFVAGVFCLIYLAMVFG